MGLIDNSVNIRYKREKDRERNRGFCLWDSMDGSLSYLKINYRECWGLGSVIKYRDVDTVNADFKTR